jgi:hypothetical protein
MLGGTSPLQHHRFEPLSLDAKVVKTLAQNALARLALPSLAASRVFRRRFCSRMSLQAADEGSPKRRCSVTRPAPRGAPCGVALASPGLAQSSPLPSPPPALPSGPAAITLHLQPSLAISCLPLTLPWAGTQVGSTTSELAAGTTRLSLREGDTDAEASSPRELVSPRPRSLSAGVEEEEEIYAVPVAGATPTIGVGPPVMVLEGPGGESGSLRPTYAALIAAAIYLAPNRRLMLPEIYDYVERHKSLVPTATLPNWRNSVRHNLSLRTCFVKVPRFTATGKKLAAHWELNITCLPMAAEHLIAALQSGEYRLLDDTERHPHEPWLRRSSGGPPVLNIPVSVLPVAPPRSGPSSRRSSSNQRGDCTPPSLVPLSHESGHSSTDVAAATAAAVVGGSMSIVGRMPTSFSLAPPPLIPVSMVFAMLPFWGNRDGHSSSKMMNGNAPHAASGASSPTISSPHKQDTAHLTAARAATGVASSSDPLSWLAIAAAAFAAP